MRDKNRLVALCLRHQAVLIEHTSQRTAIATSAPLADHLLAALTPLGIKNLEVEIWSTTRLMRWQQAQGSQKPLPPEATDFSTLPAILAYAIARRASDIHIEPNAHSYQLRIRIDGVLQPPQTLDSRLSVQIVARIKILAQLDIAEKRLPQDGQFDYSDADHPLSLRVSSLLCRHGEKLVLRILPGTMDCVGLDQIGLSPTDNRRLAHALSCPSGLILISGPTGSGKTQTLYSALSYLNSPSKNICTIEDPIEIPLTGINQTQLHVKAGLDYPTIFRALLRQDPDIIMLGEIRDQETAQLAFRAALTGHLVLSTIHAHSAAGILTRLREMTIPAWMLAATLRLLMAQRLVRKRCTYCHLEPPSTDLHAPPPSMSVTSLSFSCRQCHGGYTGRFALYELLPITREQRALIEDNCSEYTLMDNGIKQGVTTLRENGLRAAQQGLTSLEEVNRVLGFQDE